MLVPAIGGPLYPDCCCCSWYTQSGFSRCVVRRPILQIGLFSVVLPHHVRLLILVLLGFSRESRAFPKLLHTGAISLHSAAAYSHLHHLVPEKLRFRAFGPVTAWAVFGRAVSEVVSSSSVFHRPCFISGLASIAKMASLSIFILGECGI